MWFINAENNQKHLKIPNWTSENEVNECNFAELRRSIFQLSYFLVMMPIIDKAFFLCRSYAAFDFLFALLILMFSQL